jgi:hypothetical protein
VTASFQRIGEIVVLASLSLIGGCCTSYGRSASALEAVAPSLVNGEGLSTVVTSAVTQLGLSVREQRLQLGQTYYAIKSGSRGTWVTIDAQKLTIRVAWSYPSDKELATTVQHAIEQKFTARYPGSLKFKDLPCGWLGP